jgi:hypothetical protein
MRIHESDGGAVYVNAISKLSDGTDVEGHNYDLNASATWQTLRFQRGTVPEAGHNGTTNEAVLSVLIHRLKFLNGKFPCRENALAITKLEEAKLWLDERTRNRVARGVEGKHQV